MFIVDCSGVAGSSGPEPQNATQEVSRVLGDTACDVLSTHLSIDLSSRQAEARITIDATDGSPCFLEAQGLQIRETSTIGERPRHLQAAVEGGRLHVELPPTPETAGVAIAYVFEAQPPPAGAILVGTTLTWPYRCGTLFPCNSDPSDGSTFEIELTGLMDGHVAVYPSSISTDAPAYMVAWTVGEYRHHDLGSTERGTRISLWSEPRDEEPALRGAARLRDVFEWYETTLGPYPFGDHVGSVAVDWGPSGGFGGMEHHPFWHVSRDCVDSEEVHAHEAAHGWYGNSVRIRCWEEFVLSEGTASYLAARALTAVGGEAEGERIWESYRARLDRAVSRSSFPTAWPRTCGEIDILGGLFSDVPYMKGAFFFRALERRIGRDALDGILAAFFEAHRGQATGFQDLLDMVVSRTGYDPTACAEGWLRSASPPSWEVCPAVP